jgi:hypothetical protein
VNQHFRKVAQKLRDTVLMHTGSPAHLDTCSMMLGMEVFSCICADEYSLLIEWFDELCKHERQRVSRCANFPLSPLACINCDIASKHGLIFSPKFLRNEFFPRLKLLIFVGDTIHSTNNQFLKCRRCCKGGSEIKDQ